MSGLGWILMIFSLGLPGWFFVEKLRRKRRPVNGGINRSVTLPHSSEIELYSNSFSHCSRKARLALAELNIDVTHHSIDLIETGWYQTISPAYLQVNPSGLVPTLVHNGHPVYESDDILAYAQTLAGPQAPQLVPADKDLRDRMFAWLEFCSISSADAMAGMQDRAGACVPGLTLPIFITAIRYIPLRNILVGFLFHFDKKRPAMFTAAKLFGLRRMMSRKQAQSIVRSSRDHMRGHMGTLNMALIKSGGDWILGEDYTLADISIGCVLLRLEETGWLAWFAKTSDIEAVLHYYERIKARPAWRSAISAHQHPIISKAQGDLLGVTSTDASLGELVYGSLESEAS